MSKKKSSGGGCFGPLLLLALAAFGAGGMSAGADTGGGGGGIPPAYLSAYQAAASECPALDWELLAAIGWTETRHGANGGTSSAGAQGPMQFMPSTWAAYDHGSVWDIDDAAAAAAEYLCVNGLDQDDHDAAVYAYNHSWAYVDMVQAKADEYR